MDTAAISMRAEAAFINQIPKVSVIHVRLKYFLYRGGVVYNLISVDKKPICRHTMYFKDQYRMFFNQNFD